MENKLIKEKARIQGVIQTLDRDLNNLFPSYEEMLKVEKTVGKRILYTSLYNARQFYVAQLNELEN